MTSFGKRLLLAVLTLLCLSGLSCGDKTTPPADLPAPVLGTATVTGRVRFVGEPPERRMIDTSSCQAGSRVYQEETIVVGEGGGLRDVVVYLSDAPLSDGSTAPAALLDQVDCRYVPHVVAVQVNQPLKITTSDACFHNVHISGSGERDVNVGMRTAADAITERFPHAGQFARAKCDVHPWMSAHIAVIGSPFFAVSAADGRFTIDRLPPGTYTLAARHPILGERTIQITVSEGGAVDQDIEFAPPK